MFRQGASENPILFIETGDEIVKTSFFQDMISLRTYYDREKEYTAGENVLRLRGNNPAKYLSPQEWSRQSGASARSYVAKAGQYLFVCLNPPYYNEALPYGTQKYNSRFVHKISGVKIPQDILVMQYIFEQDAEQIRQDIKDHHKECAGIIFLSHAPLAKYRTVKDQNIFFPQSLLCHGYSPFEGISGEYTLTLARKLIDEIKSFARPKVMGWITGHMHLPEEKMKEGIKRIVVPAFTLAADEHGTPCPPVGHYGTTILKPGARLHLENTSVTQLPTIADDENNPSQNQLQPDLSLSI
ncbi:MAG: hypothetical protein H6863_04955 [Rhodospirillales bacterium]|nr:hypothetical protein [Rhodospirillales bacterium]